MTKPQIVKCPVDLKLKYQKLLRAANGENGEDEYLNMRMVAFFAGIEDYSDSSVRSKLFRQCESEYGQLPNWIRKHYVTIYKLNETI